MVLCCCFFLLGKRIEFGKFEVDQAKTFFWSSPYSPVHFGVFRPRHSFFVFFFGFSLVHFVELIRQH